ncbi:hypothetical protein EIP91_007501 [Steccherinum ochraceum]|uniref:Uncharacterized protein n=1 Tax=Steccherinum ochraceum TaxID=92696 RepID=A0A4R0RCG8_9APHY|nr:hypothetical protein EIP91_007501 [Steccherinum ochraceum]
MEDTHRWSELIPPQTALTFAAMYDPAEGIITFSGGSLLESGSTTSNASSPSKYSQDTYAPRDAYDSQSQVLTIDKLAYALNGTSPNTAAMALDQAAGLPFTFVCEALDEGAASMVLNLDAYGADTWRPPAHLPVRQRPRTIRVGHPIGRLYVVNGPISPDSESSQEDDRDHQEGAGPQIEWNYLRDIGNKLLSAAKTPFDGRRMFPQLRKCVSTENTQQEKQQVEEDEGFFEDACLTAASFYTAPLLVNMNLKSTFSVTTASTSPFVHVSVPSLSPSGEHRSSNSSYSDDSPITPPDETEPNVLAVPARYDFQHEDDADGDGSETWRTPTLDAFEFLEGECPNSPREFRRRLKKMRRYPQPLQTHHTASTSSCSEPREPASPDEVLARHEYNHVSPLSTPTSSPTLRPRPQQLRRQKSFTAKMRKSVVEKLTRLVPTPRDDHHGGGGVDERWVWVEVTHKVTQHVLAVSS